MTPGQAVDVLLVAAVGGLVGTFVSRAAARRFSILSHPNPNVAQHVRPVAYLGGIGVAIGVAFGIAMAAIWGDDAMWRPDVWRWDITVGAIAFLALGVADDLYAFPPARKFVLQTAAAIVVGVLVASGPDGSWADGFTAALFILVLTNGVNLVDVSDGLVAGLGMIAGVAFAIFNPGSDALAMALAGACAGFLVFNAPPASIFLGDAGSHLIGFLLAMLSFDFWRAHPAGTTATAIILVNGVVLFELLFLFVVRSAKGIPWWRGSPDHFALRMQAAGMSRWNVNAIAWIVAASLAGLALVSLRGAASAMAAAGIALVLGGVAWRQLLQLPARSR